jgi:hypothetical protein
MWDMSQEPPSTGTAVVAATNGKKTNLVYLADADLDDLYRSAVLSIKSRKPAGAGIKRADLDQMADAMATANRKIYIGAFYVAAALYEPTSDYNDPTRGAAMEYLEERAGITHSNARRAITTIDIVATVTIDEDTVGIPTIGQLNRIAQANVKEIGGWGKVNAWVKRKGGWGNVSEAAITHYCQTVKADAQAEERDRKALRTAEDEHPPADVQVVEDDDELEGVDAVPVGQAPRQRTPLNTVEQSADVRLAHSVEAFEQLMAAGTSMANNLAAFDRPPAWLELHASDFRRTRQALDHLEPMMDAATKLRAV